MSCRTWQHLLQQHLDGAGDGELEHHLQSCPNCAAEQPAVRRLLEGIALLAPTPSPVGLADQITEQLVAQARRQRRLRQRRLLGSVGLLIAAAALLLAVGIRLWWPTPVAPDLHQTNPSVVRQAEPPAEPLRDSIAQASTAVASLTSRAASQTMDQTTSLLPLLPAPRLNPMAAEAAPIEPLREASAEVSAGLAPVADSARRAVGLFLRDLPMGRNGG
jgi:hypothetical protein